MDDNYPNLYPNNNLNYKPPHLINNQQNNNTQNTINNNIYSVPENNKSYTSGNNNIYSTEKNNQNNGNYSSFKNVFPEKNYDSTLVNKENFVQKKNQNYNSDTDQINSNNNEGITPQYNDIEYTPQPMNDNVMPNIRSPDEIVDTNEPFHSLH